MFDDAIAHLKRVDRTLGDVIDRVGRQPPGPRTEGTHLGAIVRAIIYQQLSGKAAGTIHGRFLALFGGREPTAKELLSAKDEDLRSAGLSRAKALYLKDLAAKIVSGTLPVYDLHNLNDEELLGALTAVKGIGRWTAQMFLLFRLGRPNVLPELDLGIQKGVQQVYKLRRLPTPKEVQARGGVWSPFASVAAWYLWRSLELAGETGTRPACRTASATARRPAPATKGRAAKRTAKVVAKHRSARPARSKPRPSAKSTAAERARKAPSGAGRSKGRGGGK